MFNDFYGLSALVIYKGLNVCLFDYTAFAVSGKIPYTDLTTPFGCRDLN